MSKIVDVLSALTTSAQEVSNDIFVMDFTIVTACLVGDPITNNNEWILVDTGLENSGDFILQSVENRFGKDQSPRAIILTHGHFDHVGSVLKLAERWNVPVYAHPLEIPYITGQKDYPLADSTVDEGLIAKMSPIFPHTSINLGYRAVALPKDGNVPGISGWKWIHTPGHTEGHISLFHEQNKVLLAGDAFTTVKQESLLSVLTKSEQIGGPPKYLTTDWRAAESSVNHLKDLNPSLVIPSHGQPMKGEELTRHLQILVNHFEDIAKPDHGRFV